MASKKLYVDSNFCLPTKIKVSTVLSFAQNVSLSPGIVNRSVVCTESEEEDAQGSLLKFCGFTVA